MAAIDSSRSSIVTLRPMLTPWECRKRPAVAMTWTNSERIVLAPGTPRLWRQCCH